MSEKKYTPGPWFHRVDDGTLGSVDSESGAMIAQAQEISVADRMNGSSIRQANARLIACAPELLEALEYVRRFVNKENVDTDYIDTIIAKAKGEQQ